MHLRSLDTIRVPVLLVGVALSASCFACDLVTGQRVECGVESVDAPALPDGCESIDQQNDTGGSHPSGFMLCDDGNPQRLAPVSCTGCDEIPLCPLERGGCRECEAPGVCAELGAYDCFCHRPCTDDSDCAGDEACVCPMVGGAPGTRNLHPTCVPAECRSDDDCAEGSTCRLVPNSGNGARGLACTSPDDECGAGQPCPSEPNDPQYCGFSQPQGRFVCERPGEE